LGKATGLLDTVVRCKQKNSEAYRRREEKRNLMAGKAIRGRACALGGTLVAVYCAKHKGSHRTCGGKGKVVVLERIEVKGDYLFGAGPCRCKGDG